MRGFLWLSFRSVYKWSIPFTSFNNQKSPSSQLIDLHEKYYIVWELIKTLPMKINLQFRLLAILIITALNFTSKADHYSGGTISVDLDSNGVATYTLLYYSDYPNSVSNISTLDIAMPGGITKSLVLHLKDVETLLTSPMSTRQLIFQGYDTLTTAGTYSASYTHACCRNTRIVNLPFAAWPFPLEISYNYTPGQSYSSPVFLGSPLTKFPKDQLWSFNPMPYDKEGDSLFFRLGGSGYMNGYTVPPSHMSGIINIDPVSSVISWNASDTGMYVVGVFVDEYRNGALLSTTYNDIQIVVVSDTSQMEIVKPAHVNQFPQHATRTVNFIPDSLNSIDLTLLTRNTSGSVSVRSFGDVYMLGDSTVNFSYFRYSQDSLLTHFEWMPDASLRGTGPYRLNFRFSDSIFTYDYTVLIYLSGYVGVHEQTMAKLNVFPNPSNGKLSIQTDYSMEGKELNIRVFNSKGQEVYFNRESIDRSREIPLNLNLSSGLYFIRADNTKGTWSSSIVIE